MEEILPILGLDRGQEHPSISFKKLGSSRSAGGREKFLLSRHWEGRPRWQFVREMAMLRRLSLSTFHSSGSHRRPEATKLAFGRASVWFEGPAWGLPPTTQHLRTHWFLIHLSGFLIINVTTTISISSSCCTLFLYILLTRLMQLSLTCESVFGASCERVKISAIF